MQLKRYLNLSDAILLVVGNVVGAGIFTTSGFLADELSHPWLFIGIWVIGGVLTICGALTYAELASMFPKAGGDYQFLKATYGSWAGFLLGWVNFWIITPGSLAALSIALVGYLHPFFSITDPLSLKVTAIGVILFFSMINYRGIRWGGTTQDLFTLGALTILVVFIAGGLSSSAGQWQHFAAPSANASGFSKILGAPMIAVIFTYSGWFASTYIGSEIRNPEKNLPLSLIWGTLIVTFLYSFVNVTYLYALSLPEMKGSLNTASLAAARLFKPEFAYAISCAIILAIASSINANVLGATRIYYAMAEDKIFWQRLRDLHPDYGTPYISILSQAVLASLMVIVGTFSQLLSYIVFFMLLTSIMTGMAIFILRRRLPDENRSYKTWGYPYVPIIFIGAYGWIAMQICVHEPWTSAAGFLIAVSGIPFYLFWARGRDNQSSINDPLS